MAAVVVRAVQPAAGRYAGRFDRGVECRSVTSILGNCGQSNYVAAKAGMCRAVNLPAQIGRLVELAAWGGLCLEPAGCSNGQVAGINGGMA